MKKNVIINLNIILLLTIFNFAFAEPDLSSSNIDALVRADHWGFAEKIAFCEDVTDTILIDDIWVDVQYIRTTTVDCQGEGRIICQKGEVEISDLEIIQ